MVSVSARQRERENYKTSLFWNYSLRSPSTPRSRYFSSLPSPSIVVVPLLPISRRSLFNFIRKPALPAETYVEGGGGWLGVAKIE